MYRRVLMSWTRVLEPAHADTGGRDDSRRLSAVIDPSVERNPRPACACPSAPPEKRLSGASASRTVVRPTLHHFGLTTANLEAMVDWYAKVLRMAPNYRP